MSKAAELAALIGSQTALSNRNMIINGAMQVWQRGTTTDTITTGNYLCDRWRIAHNGTDGNVDVDQSTDVPSGQGFGYSQKISMDASETSLDAGDQVNIQQRFEGQNLQLLEKGSSSAKKVTLSFWVKSSVAATYSINLVDNDNTRIIGATYVVNSAILGKRRPLLLMVTHLVLWITMQIEVWICVFGLTQEQHTQAEHLQHRGVLHLMLFLLLLQLVGQKAHHLSFTSQASSLRQANRTHRLSIVAMGMSCVGVRGIIKKKH